MATKAFAYPRVSGLEQTKDGKDGLPRQRRVIAKYAKAHRIEVVQEFAEEGVSGENELADRPALMDLLAAVTANGVRLILVENQDRLARDVIVQELIVAECQRLGVRIIAADSGLDLTEGDKDNPNQKLVRVLLGAVSEWAKCMAVIRMRAARIRKRKATGRCEGARPFGGDPARPGEAATVERVRQLHTGKPRLSLSKIATILNGELDRHPPRHAHRWSKMLVKAVVDRL
jgi:DNA invertase Pin-like site-specific DNA recombinase